MDSENAEANIMELPDLDLSGFVAEIVSEENVERKSVDGSLTAIERKKEWFINQVRQCCCHYDVLTL